LKLNSLNIITPRTDSYLFTHFLFQVHITHQKSESVILFYGRLLILFKNYYHMKFVRLNFIINDQRQLSNHLFWQLFVSMLMLNEICHQIRKLNIFIYIIYYKYLHQVYSEKQSLFAKKVLLKCLNYQNQTLSNIFDLHFFGF